MDLNDILTLTPKGTIGGIQIQATLEEVYSDTLQVTEHPVEFGAAITDHAYKRPSEVVLRCGWSNSTLASLAGAVAAFFNGGGLSASDYVSGVYSQLLALQESRIPFSITTNKRQYDDMLIVGLSSTVDNTTSNMLMLTATCRQIIIVSTQATTLPGMDSQADPASTAETDNVGVVQPQSGSPSPGGSVSPEAM